MSTTAGFLELGEQLDEFGDGLEEMAGDEMVNVGDAVAEETAETVAEDAKRFAPVKTGELRESITVLPQIDPMIRHVLALADHSKHVEYGTQPHIIQPTEETTYDEPIEHPGATAKPYLRPALWYNHRSMHRAFEDEMERLIRRTF